jgi:hypothetical protein
MGQVQLNMGIYLRLRGRIAEIRGRIHLALATGIDQRLRRPISALDWMVEYLFPVPKRPYQISRQIYGDSRDSH